MKIKFTVLTLAAALAIPAMSAHVFKFDNPNGWTRDGKNGAPTAVVTQSDAWGSKTLNAKSEMLTWDFEEEAQFNQFTLIDNDGDGYNWQYFNYEGETGSHMTPHQGYGNISSASYVNSETGSGGTALHPDNWIISPQVELKGALKFWAAGQDANYAAEVFAVYACVGTPSGIDSFVKISDDITATGDYTEYEFSLNQFEGQTGCFAIRHYNVTDMFWLNVDDITLDPDAILVTPPTELAAEPAATSAELTWVSGENNATWNLRYRPYVDPANQSFLWDFPLDSYLEQLEGWTIYDADGDGNNWAAAYSSSAQDDVCLYSASYSSGALTPDNWLFTPEVALGGTLSFDTWNASDSYPDKIMVYVCTNPDWESLEEFVAVSEFIQPSAAGENITIDLSSYADQTGIIAFRHYDCVDMLRIYIDNIAVTNPNAQPIPEWIEIDQVSSPYEITGLTPLTEYEAQVQGVAENGRTSEWTKSVRFTTLEEQQEPAKYYIVGGFNAWNTNEPLEITEEGATIEVQEQNLEDSEDTAQEFKLITPAEEEGEWIWLGGIDENGVGYFDLTAEMLAAGTEITLDDEGANFRLPAAGNYTIKLVEEEESKAPVASIKMVVVMNDSPGVAVTDINGKTVAGVKYVNIAGMESNVPFDGVNIVVTTYTDGTKAAVKVIK